MKTAYLFDSATKEFISEVQAQESPLEKGVYLQPANTLWDAPPALGDNEVAVEKDGAWEIKPDFRGIWYKPDHTTVEITEIDVAPEGDWSKTDPEPTVQEIILGQIADLDAQLNEIDLRTLRTRGAREYDIMAAPLLAVFQSMLTPEQLTMLATVQQQLYGSNPEYKRVVDAETSEAATLRAQRRNLSDQLDAMS